MTGVLDKLPPFIRHLVIAVLPVLLAWVASDVIPTLQGKEGLAGLLAVVLGAALAVLTPWVTTQYGVGAGGTVNTGSATSE